MKKLTDVYIKVTKQNRQWLSELFDSSSLELNTYIDFYAEDYRCKFYYSYAPKDKQKVTLAELKRLINTIPTREEIKRLKQQISAYKMNYDKVVKHSLSKEDVIENLQRDNESLKHRLIKLRELNDVIYKDVDILTKENKELQKDNDILVDCMEKLDDKLEVTEIKLNIQADLIRDKNAQLEQLKQRKWWQIWK